MSIRRAFQKVLFPSIIVASFLMSACASSATTPTAMPTGTPPPPDTQTPTLTPAPSPIPTRILTPTIALIPPFPTKQVVVDYDVSGDYSLFDISSTDHRWSKLVLYANGQLIIPGRKPQQIVLSKDEVDQVLLNLKDLGFFRLESNQQQDQTDKLYNMGYQSRLMRDARLYCVLVNAEKSRRLCAYEPFLKFLVPEMKNILYYLDHFEPPGMTAYSPDRILLWVERGRDPFLTDLPENSVAWNSKLPPLTTSDQKIIYLQGEPAREVYALFGNQISPRVFNQDGIDYTAQIDIVLPHEEITNRYEQ